MLVLGIDPGTATTGFGIINLNDKRLMEVIEFGLIETSKDLSPEIRLSLIHAEMLVILDKFKPDVLAIERIFFTNNAKTAIRVGQAQGVVLLAAAQKNIKVTEYAPGTIKKAVSGNGRANKLEVQKSVRLLLGPKVKSEVKKKTHFDNAADALAIAVCHIYSL